MTNNGIQFYFINFDAFSSLFQITQNSRSFDLKSGRINKKSIAFNRQNQITKQTEQIARHEVNI